MQVPLPPRDIWRQRLRWVKCGHLFVLDRDSFFFNRNTRMTLYQKAVWALFPLTSIVQCFCAPVMHTLPFLCVVCEICPFGMDRLLFFTHMPFLGMCFIFTIYHSTFDRMWASLSVRTTVRVLWFTHVKACVNTVMVFSGWKARGQFVVTPKGGAMVEKCGSMPAELTLAASAAGSEIPTGRVQKSARSSKSGDGDEDSSGGSGASGGGGGGACKREGNGSTGKRMHAALSRVTEARRRVLPLDGTLDVWVLAVTTSMSIVAMVYGVRGVYKDRETLDWRDGLQALRWMGIVYALVEATPGLLFFGCGSDCLGLGACLCMRFQSCRCEAAPEAVMILQQRMPYLTILRQPWLLEPHARAGSVRW